MDAEWDVRPSRRDAERFVAKLKGFHDSLDPVERRLLKIVLDSAQGGEVVAHGMSSHGRLGGSSGEGWNDLVWWLAEEDAGRADHPRL
jgi:hypothetical protein